MEEKTNERVEQLCAYYAKLFCAYENNDFHNGMPVRPNAFGTMSYESMLATIRHLYSFLMEKQVIVPHPPTIITCVLKRA
jgi:hypothetical protein